MHDKPHAAASKPSRGAQLSAAERGAAADAPWPLRNGADAWADEKRRQILRRARVTEYVCNALLVAMFCVSAFLVISL